VFETIIEQLHALPSADKGRHFERLVAWYLRTAPEYRNLVRRVYLWDEWPGRWGADAGIDLVAHTNAGDTWAVQAKAYAASYSIKKADVDSFLSESNRREFSFRLLIATTDRLGQTAARTIHEQEKPVGVRLLSQLRHEAVVWPESLEMLEAPAPQRLVPRPHQVEAIEGVLDGLQKVDRGQLIMACGTGKTLTALWIDEALASRRTLVIVPSLSLLGQTPRAWTAQSAQPFDYLAVCSDETVAATDSFTSWTADLGVPVTTDSEVVRAFLAKRGARRVIFVTYHSTPVLANAQDAGGRFFDLAIVDEAHRAAGRVDSSFGTVLDANRISSRKRLFMTATPRLVSSHVQAAARERDLEITSMDDPAKFGPVLHRLSFRDAIERGLLSDYRVVVIAVDDPGVGRAVARRELLTIGRRVIDAETLARQVGLVRAVVRFGLNPERAVRPAPPVGGGAGTSD
jgi:predicted helicase